MKRIFLSFSLLFFVIAGYSQALVPVKIDSLVTVSLPQVHQEKDTLTQKIYSGNSLYGFMTVIRTANDNNNTPLKKETDLKKVLKDYITKIQAQAPGSEAIRLRDTTVGTLEARNFSLKNDDGAGNIQIINFTLIYTKDAVYTLEYVYPEIRADLVKGEYKAFISSIRLSRELQRDDQYLLKTTGMSLTTKIEIGAGALVIILIAFFIIRRKKKLAIS
jgi:hypothetical protein